ncbi:MAG TPA: tetratricopeptide repeat protein, partial [Phycisphaerae bacterium]|nr:tetratricopeptide repeat protein [Phycisphaerae bacterium]
LVLKTFYPEAYNNLGNALMAKQNTEAAIRAYRRAIECKPDYSEAHYNLGIALVESGQMDSAINAYRTAISFKPDYAAAYNNLGNTLKKKRLYKEAIEAYRAALQIKPDYLDVLNNMANALQDQNLLAEALDVYRTALRIDPNDARVHYNIGNAFKAQSRFAEALDAMSRAVGLKPDFPEAYSMAGNIFLALGRLDEAAAACRKAIELRPQYAEAYNNLGNVFMAQGRLSDAAEAHQTAIRINPDFVDSLNNLGNVFNKQNRPDEAIAAYRRAIEIKPELAEAHCNLGNILKDVGLFDEAIAESRRAIEIKPDFAVAWDNLLFTLNYHPDFTGRIICEELKRWRQGQCEALKKFILPHKNNRDPERRLKIGYVSADFGEHACGLFLNSLLRLHDHKHFEIFCYAEMLRSDELTARFQSYADQWRSSVGLTDEQFAAQIRNDGIDILVDLKLHTNENRLLAFARKPAPVQVTWLGYPGSTGLDTIDYRLTDPYLDPPGPDDKFYSEESIRLPDCFWCYDPLAKEPAVNELPALQNGFITFGCLNNFCKINQRVLELWIQILNKVNLSRLMILANPGEHCRRTLELFEKNGVASDRVEFVAKRSRPEYLKLYHHQDIVLDTVPYNGHTTGFDALWMGVPVATLMGKTAVGRAGWSQLCNLDLRELAAQTPQEYVEIAVKLAGDLPRLTELRKTLRQRMENSPLMNAKCFTNNVEAIYRDIWRKWATKSL